MIVMKCTFCDQMNAYLVVWITSIVFTTFVYKHFLSDHYLIELNHYSAISFVCMHMLRSEQNYTLFLL